MRSAKEFSSSSAAGGGGADTEVTAPPISGVQHSSWQSPVPYLFAGLAAMLGLIALALLVLACSYWKLSGYLDSDGAAGDGDVRDKAGDDRSNAQPKVFEEKVLVIMAGDRKPTYLATPTAGHRASSAGESGAGESEEKPPEGSSSLGGCPATLEGAQRRERWRT